MTKNKLLLLLALLMVAVTGAVAQTTYKVSVKVGTKDAEKWTVEPTEAAAGTQVTVTYSGLKSVNSVKAVKKAAVPYFSVSSTQKVVFAPGNLQAGFAEAGTSDCIWQFAPTQYSYIGNAPANNALGNNCVTKAGIVDLFGWVGEHSSLAAYGINSDGESNNYGGTAGEALKSDWAVVANDANLGGHNDWHTPTYAEWDYLFNTRTNASEKYGHGQIGNYNGVIILPDVWVLPDGLSFTAGQHAYSDNVYTLDEWAKMEENGAVFLPAAGYRTTATKFNYINKRARYWSSTSPKEGLDNASITAYTLFINENTLGQNNYKRHYGYSVRLVRFVE